LVSELREAGLSANSQQPSTVRQVGEVGGKFAADLVIEKQIIVESKSVRRIIQSHEIQLVNYLVATGTDVGLLLNCAERNVEAKRTQKDASTAARCPFRKS
jgi:GxxExxY protein